MTPQDKLIADLTEQRDRARAIAVMLEQEVHDLRTALERADVALRRIDKEGIWSETGFQNARDDVARALAVVPA